MSVETQLRRKQLASEGRENLDWVLYDSLFTTAGATQTLTFFQNTIGGVGRARTNMKNAGSLPSPQSFFITEIMCKIFNQNGAGFFIQGDGGAAATPVEHPVNTMIAQGSFDYVLEPSTEYEGHMSQLRDSLDRVEDATATGLATAAIPGSFVSRSLKLRKPIIVEPARAFSLRMTLTTPAASGGYTANNTLIYWYLFGVLQRNA